MKLSVIQIWMSFIFSMTKMFLLLSAYLWPNLFFIEHISTPTHKKQFALTFIIWVAGT